MPRKMWISANEAAEILTQNSGRSIHADYVRLLAKDNKIRSRAVDGRTKEYYRPDVENRTVRAKRKNGSAQTQEELPEPAA